MGKIDGGLGRNQVMLEWFSKDEDTVEGTTDEGIIYSVKKNRTVVNKDFIKVYRGVFYKIVEIHGCARDLMEFLIEEMNGDNIVNNNEYTRQKFLDAVNPVNNRTGGRTYKVGTVNIAFSELNARGLIQTKTKGTFEVNPRYFWKHKSEKKRLEKIKMFLTFEANAPIKINVDRSENFNVGDDELPKQ